MKPASFLSVLTCASLVFVSVSALAAPGDAPPKKKKPKSSVASKAPKKVESADPDATPAAAPATTTTTPGPVAPETKAADAKPAEAKPEPIGSASAASPSSAAGDHPNGSRHEDDVNGGKAFSVAPLLGFGTNHFGLGTGVRAGYTFPAKVYVGATFMYHFGSSYAYDGYLGGADYSSHVLYPAGEVGYDFHVGPVTIRPYAGVGIAFISSTISYAGAQSDGGSTSSLLLYPGATAFWNIPHSDFFVGGDTRMVILTRGGDPSFSLFATGGLKF